MNILLVEDDDDTARYAVAGLRRNGYTVDRTKNGEEGLSHAQAGAHDVIILDRMLPEFDGLTLAKRLRQQGVQTPILFLTNLGGIQDRVDGLDAGGDDYLVKPFALMELVARVNSLTRRKYRTGGDIQTTLRIGDLEIDIIARAVCRSGQPIELQPQEYRLLEYLARYEGQIVTRAMLLENVWELPFSPNTNIVESHMSRLRSKIDKNFPNRLIHTVRKAGYTLRAD